MASPAPACRQAISDANRRWPRRRKESDGILGDARHQKTKSDHNLGNAFDLTHDPASGCDGNVIAAAAIRDPRVKYVIWNRRIFNRQRGDSAFRRYTGKNPHTHHCHVSILAGSRGDTRPWAWAPGGGQLPALTTPAVEPAPRPAAVGGGGATPADRRVFPGVVLKRGSRGELVTLVQRRLKQRGWDIDTDGVFGDDTLKVVRAFQRRHGLDPDGEVGRRTWTALFG
jgi:hypothetical protein